MPVIVNGTELTDGDVERELSGQDEPEQTAQLALDAAVLRRVLLDEAARLDIGAGALPDAAIEALLAREVVASEPTDAECERQYLANPERWRIGERVRVRHILFQVTERVDLERLRAKAQKTLDEILRADDPDARFALHARTLSNCPSGAQGGDLGEIGRGDTVPEFEHAVFAAPANSVCPALVETRFGFHVIRVLGKSAGEILPFERAHAQIRSAMSRAAADRARRQYLIGLVARSDIQGWKETALA
jgi:peptidyl-prolyl cis-trans isomerase C